MTITTFGESNQLTWKNAMDRKSVPNDTIPSSIPVIISRRVIYLSSQLTTYHNSLTLNYILLMLLSFLLYLSQYYSIHSFLCDMAFYCLIPNVLCHTSRMSNLSVTICLTLAVLLGGAGITQAQTQGQPANSFVSGSEWYCNSGYRKSGNECVSIFE